MARQSLARELLNQLKQYESIIRANYLDALPTETKEGLEQIAQSLGIPLQETGSRLNEITSRLDVEVLADQDITIEEAALQFSQEQQTPPAAEETLESRVPDRVLLEQLLKDLDEAELKKGDNAIKQEIERLSKKKEYGSIRNQIQKAVERKISIQAEIENRLEIKGNLSKEEQTIIADKLSDAYAATTTVLENDNVDQETINKLKETVILEAEKNTFSSEGTLDTIENAVETELRQAHVTEDTVILVKSQLAHTTAEAIIEIKASKEAERVVAEIEKTVTLTPEKRAELKQALAQRVELVWEGKLESVEVSRAITPQAATTSINEEISILVGEQVVLDDTEIRSINTRIGEVKTVESEVIRLVREQKLIDDSWKVGVEAFAKGEVTLDQLADVYELAKFTGEITYPDTDFIRSENSIKEEFTKGKSYSQAITGIIKAPQTVEQQVKTFSGIRKRVVQIIPKLPKEVKALDGVVTVLQKDEKLLHFFEQARRFARAKKATEELVSKLTGKAVGVVATSLGVNATATTISNIAYLASGGLSVDAMWAIGAQIMNGTLPATLEAVSAAAASGGFMGGVIQLFTSLGLAETPAGAMALSGIGQVHAGLVKFGSRIAAKSPWMAKIGGGVSKTLSNGLGTVAKGAATWAKAAIPGAVSAVGTGLMSIGTAFLGLFSGLSSISFAPIIAIVVVAIFVGFFVFQAIQSMQMAALVPPPMEQTNCKRLEPTGSPAASDGKINCNTTVPEKNVPGVDRENFFRIADQWKSPANHARECFNDVVCRARSAGVDEAFALWVWVHESGASNYSIADVEDFGIHGQSTAPPKDFNAQINFFLKLQHGNPCPSLDYWLGWSTNYLTGSCDPDKKVSGGGGTMMSGRDYLAAIKSQWNWISSNSMPTVIRKTGTGESCGGGANYSADNSTYTYVDENGDTWLCQNTPGLAAPGDPIVVPDFAAWDPNTPVPEGCPSGEPTKVGSYTEGPFAPGCSHQSMSSAAVDYGIVEGTPVYATHPGVVSLGGGPGDAYGFYVDLHGKCEGQAFNTRYAHFKLSGYAVTAGQTVKKGDLIGYSDNTGHSTGPHLHYHITGLDKNKFGQYMGISVEKTKALWGCCGWGSNTKYCPSR